LSIRCPGWCRRTRKRRSNCCRFEDLYKRGIHPGQDMILSADCSQRSRNCHYCRSHTNRTNYHKLRSVPGQFLSLRILQRSTITPVRRDCHIDCTFRHIEVDRHIRPCPQGRHRYHPGT
jgi:hypothetical protein